MLHLLFKDRRCDQSAFFVVGNRLDQLDQFPFLVGCPDIFGKLSTIASNNRIGGVNDVLGGAVILLQFDDPQIRIISLEIENVGDVCTAKCVNALGIISYDADVLTNGRQLSDNKVLAQVRVLKFVDQHILESVLVFIQYIEMFLEEPICVE